MTHRPMNLLILADIDDYHWLHGSGEADALLSLGDVYDQVILEAAAAFGVQKIFAVKGNHDSSDQFPSPIVDLHLTTITFGGLTFGGHNGSWRYKPKGHFLYEQDEVTAALKAFPAVDVFLSHNSPGGVHDRDDGVHTGFDGLLAYIHRVQPRLLLHGHQHINRESSVGRTLVIGVYGHRIQALDVIVG